MALVTFRNLLDESSEFESVDNPHLIHCAAEFARAQDDEIYDLIMSEKVMMYLNGIEISVDDWALCLVKEYDEVVITPVIAGGQGGALQIILGAVMMIVGATITVLSYGGASPLGVKIMMLGAVIMIGGIIQALTQTDLPLLATGNRETQTYSWSGIKTTAKYGAPVPIIYGCHRVGGNVISVFTENYSSKDNYLYLLLALCEGEIDGIARENNYASACNTSFTASVDAITKDATYYNPAIEIDDQPLRNYQDVEWWSRNGTNDKDANKSVYNPTAQNKIPYFDNERVQFDLGDEIGRLVDSEEVVYTTTKPVDMVKLQIKSPALYRLDNGSFIDETVDYTIAYKETNDSTYITTVPNNIYTAAFTDNKEGGMPALNSRFPETFECGHTYIVANTPPPKYIIKIIHAYISTTKDTWGTINSWTNHYEYNVYDGIETDANGPTGDILNVDGPLVTSQRLLRPDLYVPAIIMGT